MNSVEPEVVAAIGLVLFVVGFALGRYRRALREHMGEGYIRKLLHQSFPSSDFHILNNVTLPVGTHTTQIDHILVSTRGIFVIETKHYSGWIFGDERSKNWTQVIYQKKSRFQNPLHQNYKHVKVVEQLLDFLPSEAVFNVVVFTGSAKFKTNTPEGVFNPDSLVSYINSRPAGALSNNRVAFSVGRLECARYQISRQTDFEHQRNLEKRYGTAI